VPLDPGGDAIVRVEDTAYILFQVPDLQRQQSFLEDFGMHLVHSAADAIYMRGCGPQPYIYKAQRGPVARFLGTGYAVHSESALQSLAAATGVQITGVDGPGGGQRVRLRDPDGFIVDVIFGREPLSPLPTRRDPYPVNTPQHKQRVNRGQRPPLEPCAVERYGHCVLMATDFVASYQWYHRHLGVIATDVLCTGDGRPVLAFTRFDRGATPADHHSVVLAQGAEARYMHSAFEALDQDAIGQGQQFLKLKGWKHFWGMGRHILGSQIFDYWLDPNGYELEHYADGDVYDSSHQTQYHLADRGGLWAWGDDVPDALRPRRSLRDLWNVFRITRSKGLDLKMFTQLMKAMQIPPRPWLK
jgi:catechol 2,3-dioxygenase-like lactoylglutathione lyase family enzyme